MGGSVDVGEKRPRSSPAGVMGGRSSGSMVSNLGSCGVGTSRTASAVARLVLGRSLSATNFGASLVGPTCFSLELALAFAGDVGFVFVLSVTRR